MYSHGVCRVLYDVAPIIKGGFMKLTVIIRNDGPLVFCDDSPSYRSVQIDLTDEQMAQIQLKNVGVNCGRDVTESYSKCFLEE